MNRADRRKLEKSKKPTAYTDCGEQMMYFPHNKKSIPLAKLYYAYENKDEKELDPEDDSWWVEYSDGNKNNLEIENLVYCEKV